MKEKIKNFFKNKKNIKDLMFVIAFLIIFVNTLFLNIHVAFYLLALFIIIAAIF